VGHRHIRQCLHFINSALWKITVISFVINYHITNGSRMYILSMLKGWIFLTNYGTREIGSVWLEKYRTENGKITLCYKVIVLWSSSKFSRQAKVSIV
jgi:hypothetical protein